VKISICLIFIDVSFGKYFVILESYARKVEKFHIESGLLTVVFLFEMNEVTELYLQCLILSYL